MYISKPVREKVMDYVNTIHNLTPKYNCGKKNFLFGVQSCFVEMKWSLYLEHKGELRTYKNDEKGFFLLITEIVLKIGTRSILCHYVRG